MHEKAFLFYYCRYYSTMGKHYTHKQLIENRLQSRVYFTTMGLVRLKYNLLQAMY